MDLSGYVCTYTHTVTRTHTHTYCLVRAQGCACQPASTHPPCLRTVTGLHSAPLCSTLLHSAPLCSTPLHSTLRQVWDYETIDNADITEDSSVFEMEPLTEIRVGSNVNVKSLVRSTDPDTPTLWYAQDANGAIWKVDVIVSHTVSGLVQGTDSMRICLYVHTYVRTHVTSESCWRKKLWTVYVFGEMHLFLYLYICVGHMTPSLGVPPACVT